MNNERIVIERIYNAPIEKVWSALTNKEEIKKWSFDFDGFKPEVGFEFSFPGGKDGTYVHLSKVVEVVTGSKLAYTWRYKGYEGDSVVSYELFREGDKTRIRLTHQGIDSISVNGPDFSKDNFIQGWTQIIGTSLKDYVEAA